MKQVYRVSAGRAVAVARTKNTWLVYRIVLAQLRMAQWEG